MATTSYYGHGYYLGGIVTFFRTQNALSVENAVPMEKIDWYSIGMMGSPETVLFGKSSYPYIKKTNNGLYWLDLQALEKHIEWSNKSIKYLIIFSLVFVVFGTIVAALSEL